MAAAAFKAVLVFQTETGRQYTVPCTVSDVVGEFYIAPSGSNDIQLPSGEGIITLKDVILSASGTDTSKAEIYVNDLTTGVQIMNSANVGTVFNRQFMSAMMHLKEGARLKIKQA